MRAAALRVELHIPGSQSLKDKRAVLRPLIEGLRRRASLSVVEVDRQDGWQRATIGVAIAAGDGAQLAKLVSSVRHYLDGRVDVEVLEIVMDELEMPD